MVNETAGNSSARIEGSDSDWPAIEALLAATGQQHLGPHLRALPGEARAALVNELQAIDFAALRVASEDHIDISQVQAPEVLTLDHRASSQGDVEQLGRAAFEQGKVAVLIVAGGQASRLGCDFPKGCFEIGLVAHQNRRATLFQILSEKFLSIGSKAPLLIMTSDYTDAATRAYFEDNLYFGLNPHQVRFFKQGTLPTLDDEGHVLLDPGSEGRSLLKNPDGHGGCVTALVNSGLLEEIRSSGVRYLLYVQIDNPLAAIPDYFLIGSMIRENLDMVTKVIAKSNDAEKVGNLISIGGSDAILEYTELPEHLAGSTDDSGRKIFRFGNTGMHGFAVDFLAQAAASGGLKPHRSRKKVLAWEAGGAVERVAYKHERFIFDLIRSARHRGIEVSRADEFAPVKNASGNDSPESSRALMLEQFRAWCASAGIEVPEHVLVEVSPLFAANADEFVERVKQYEPELTRITEHRRFHPPAKT